MKVLKFGGSSLGSLDRVASVVEIIHTAAGSHRVAVVVSALAGVTDGLTHAVQQCASGRSQYEDLCEEISRRHLQAATELVAVEEQPRLAADLAAKLAEVRELLHGVSLIRECTPRSLDLILSYGERLAAALVSAALRHRGVAASACDARALVVTDESFGGARVDVHPTYRRFRNHFAHQGELQVVTGFIGATPDGETTTLGRGGSDLTAALLGVALGAEVIELWTNVDGVMSADPRLVPSAFSLDCISYDELMELSHFGAKVVYPPTVHPARSGSIPLLIKNTLNPSFPGTSVVEKAPPGRHPIRGISSINQVALLRLEGDGMVGVPGTAKRLFDALAREGISVILISQASSEHSICFAVQPQAVGAAKQRIEEEFALERQAGLIDDLVIEEDLSVIAAVGEGMRERPGIAGRLFSVLGDRGVNVRAIAQGSSELNISLVLAREDEARALNAIHDAFFLARGRTVDLLVAGTGRIGGALLAQIHRHAGEVADEAGVTLRLAGLCNSRQMALDRGGLDPGEWQAALRDRGGPTDLVELARFAASSPGLAILVDCTASDAVPGLYPQLLAAGGVVVTANKRPFSGPLAELRRLRPTRQAPLYYETTVGAGLPVLRTLRQLVETGDRLVKLEGVFSGTLGFLFSELRRGQPFSEAVGSAVRQGLTEPDPREDLSGQDVARKLLILAREAGLDLEPEGVAVESLLVDPRLAAVPLEEFFSALPGLDEVYTDRQRRSTEEGGVLVYLARLEGGHARVGLETVAPQHPCAQLRGTDNLFAFTTERYADSPLVVRGPGAGPAVTAAGVLADILRALREG